jgi:DNA invertase Pin-like site-specific DNA recombinase
MIPVIYARVSTEDQHCEMQLSELRAYVERCGWPAAVEYIEKASGKAGSKRPVLKRLLDDARLKKFDCVLVWKLDRFGRSLHHLIENVQLLDDHGIRFVSPSQGIDTDNRSPVGRLLLHMMAAFAEFERSLIVERVRTGVKEAQRQGKHCGRPKRVFRRDDVRDLRAQGKSWREISLELGIPVGTVRKAVSGVA